MKNNPNNEEVWVRYLLGDLSEAEQIRLEEQFFTDEDLYEQLLALEDELKYDYAQGKLSASDRKRFEKRFLVSDVDRRQVEQASAVIQAIHNEKAERQLSLDAHQGWWQKLSVFLAFQNTAMRFALATAAFVLLAASAWLAFETIKLRRQVGELQAQRATEEQQLRQQSQEEQNRASQLASELEKERSQRAQLEQELARKQEELERPPRQRSILPAIISFVLTPGAVRGEGAKANKFLIPADASTVQFRVALKKAEYSSYRAAILTADGAEIWRQSGLRPKSSAASQSLLLKLPAKRLPAGDYEVSLKGQTAAGVYEEVRDSYYFNVVKK